MQSTDVAIATISLARDESEERLLERALAALAAHGIAMFIADGGSPARFVGSLRSLDGARLVEPRGRGLVAQVRASVAAAAASGARFVLYTEPDKLLFFERHLAPLIDAAGDGDDAGVALAARSDAALATFPIMQRTTETAINRVCGELVGRDGDFCYGPFLLHRSLAEHLDALPDDLGWGWRFALFVAAHRAGRRVELVEGEYGCPADQRDETERDRLYRITQLEQNVRGVLLGARV